MRLSHDPVNVLIHSTEPPRAGSAALVHLGAIAASFEQAGYVVTRSWANPSHRLPRRLVMGVLAFARLAPHSDVAYFRWHVVDVAPLIMARLYQLPYVLEINGPVDDIVHAHEALHLLRPILDRVARWQFTGAGAVVAVSEGLGRWAVSMGAPAAATVAVENGAAVSVQRFRRSAASAPYVVYFGDLSERQGIEFLLSARRSESWPAGLGLTIIGDGLLRPQVVAAAQEGLLTYAGRLDQDETHRRVAAASVSVSLQSPDFERNHMMGLPFKCVESAMLGVPVVGTALSGQKTALAQMPFCETVAYGDVEELAAALTRCSRVSHSGRDELAEYAAQERSWAKAGERTVKIVERALSAALRE